MISAYSPSETPGVRILVLTSDYFFSFSSAFLSFFREETIYQKAAFVFPFLVLQKPSGALSHSFLSIAFELTISRGFVKEKPRRLSLNRIAEEEALFSVFSTL